VGIDVPVDNGDGNGSRLPLLEVGESVTEEEEKGEKRKKVSPKSRRAS